ncbi:IBR domain containing protein [Reticulomyxa filosa]|uniref:IBR domain containing protein n=1 Tax=Reticulomyxa filosa TaxID=46433 RepID=X6N9X4_RETFI|nr:IBR domain containing protein [Reticulomyxa filosa]|eukprot:ETO23095.1 IBR domain containing protein [Reticulomyxa filosa]
MDITINQIMEDASTRWNCSVSEAKMRLKSSLWDVNMESELAITRTSNSAKQQQQQDMKDEEEEEKDNAWGNLTTSVELALPDNKWIEDGYECPICLLRQCVFRGIQLSCQHIICRSCLSDYLKNSILSSGNPFITCPAFKCNAPIEECVIHVLTDLSTFAKYRQNVKSVEVVS